MRKERKHFTPEEKVAILRRHLVGRVPVSELCEELGLRPTVFYRWQKELFENGAAAAAASTLAYRRFLIGAPGRRWLFCREECKQRDSNRDKDHNVLRTILPVHPVRHGLRRLDCHREPMGKA